MKKKSHNIKFLFLLLALSVGTYGITQCESIKSVQSKTIYEAPLVKPIVEKIKATLSSETDQAVSEAQKKVEKERQQLLSEIADLQARQEKKVERLKELESLGFTPESN